MLLGINPVGEYDIPFNLVPIEYLSHMESI